MKCKAYGGLFFSLSGKLYVVSEKLCFAQCKFFSLESKIEQLSVKLVELYWDRTKKELY